MTVSSLTGLYEAPPIPSQTPTSDEDTVRFISLAVRSYAAVDEIPARIEEGIEILARGLGFSADCTATATAIFITLARGERRWTEVIRVRVSSPDFTRAVALHRLLERVGNHEITPRDASERLVQLLAWRRASSPARTIIASALLSASAALLLHAQGRELGLVGLLGAVVGGVLYLVGGREQLVPLATVLLAALASAAAFGASSFGWSFVRPVPTLVASLVILFPG
ncbi:MAG: threonine/serine exporter family protein, partial [Gemmatimonadaceae bacterium]